MEREKTLLKWITTIVPDATINDLQNVNFLDDLFHKYFKQESNHVLPIDEPFDLIQEISSHLNCDLSYLNALDPSIIYINILELFVPCAVNSDNKEKYINDIMMMDKEDQEIIKEIIVQYETNVISPHPKMDTLKRLQNEILILTQDKNDLVIKNQLLINEINNLKSENNVSNQDFTNEDIDLCKNQIQKLTNELAKCKDELYRLDNAKDDYETQISALNREIIGFKKKEEELSNLAVDVQKYKDELDIYKHMSEKIPRYEATIENYKKKLEELSFKNGNLSDEPSHIPSDNELENEKRRFNVLKSELDALKITHRELVTSQQNVLLTLEQLKRDKEALLLQNNMLETQSQNLAREKKKLEDQNDYLNLCMVKVKESDNSSAPKNKTDVSEALINKVRELEKALEEKDSFYMDYLKKAKMIIESMKQNAKLNENQSDELKNLKEENERLKQNQETIAQAWNNMALKMYKQNMNETLSDTLWEHNSFLNRQREILLSKPK